MNVDQMTAHLMSFFEGTPYGFRIHKMMLTGHSDAQFHVSVFGVGPNPHKVPVFEYTMIADPFGVVYADGEGYRELSEIWKDLATKLMEHCK